MQAVSFVIICIIFQARRIYVGKVCFETGLCFDMGCDTMGRRGGNI